MIQPPDSSSCSEAHSLHDGGDASGQESKQEHAGGFLAKAVREKITGGVIKV